MLRRLSIRNFAIIDQIEVEFDAGMTVLTGETGAGKSILVDALALVLGERGGAKLIRPGASRAEFSAEFDLSGQKEAQEWLCEQALDVDDECLLRRVIGDDGRSRAFINGNSVPLQSLQDLGERLLDIHGQHAHQSLGRRSVQRELLDHFGNLQPSRAATEQAYAKWQSLRQRAAELQDADDDRIARLDLLDFQTRELEALGITAEEHDALAAERHRLKNAAGLADEVSKALLSLYDSDAANAQSLLAAACHSVERSRAFDPDLEPVHTMLEEASIQVSEAAATLHRYLQTLDMDPERRDWVEERLDAIQAVARKHRVEPRELPEVQRQLKSQLEALSDAKVTGERLAEEASEAKDLYLHEARGLSDARRTSAKGFQNEVQDAMQSLGMPGGIFEIALRPLTQEQARPSGLDEVEFLISANPGQAPQPLAKIASGGELSRMSLAIQVIASDGSSVPTMVFDEVDSGVGGGVAEMLGRRLKDLGATRQVLCVTHLPQVASLAHHHFCISKTSDDRSTATEVQALEGQARIEELARMLGGVKITRRTREHAAEMLQAGTGKSARGRLRAAGS